jgi:hypothetical protein
LPATACDAPVECGEVIDANCGTTIDCGDNCTPPEVCLTDNTCGEAGNWWEIYDEPNANNTGPNPIYCPSNWLHGGICPDTSLTDYGNCSNVRSEINSQGDGALVENFMCDGELQVERDNVTLRNFFIHGAASARGIEMGSVSGCLFEFGEIHGIGRSTNECIQGRGYTGRYLEVHDCDDTSKTGGVNQGPMLIEHSYIYNVYGSHGDTFQVYGDGQADSAVTVRFSALEAGDELHITTDVVGGVVTFHNNWIYAHDGSTSGGLTGYYFNTCTWDSGDVRTCEAGTNIGQECTGDGDCPGSTCENRAIYVHDNLFSRDNLQGGLASGGDGCLWINNLWMNDFSPAER